MDVAEDPVQAILRFNGYPTVSEGQIQTLNKSGDWQNLTDGETVTGRGVCRTDARGGSIATLQSVQVAIDRFCVLGRGMSQGLNRS